VYRGCHPRETHFTSLFINALSHHQNAHMAAYLMSMKTPLRPTGLNGRVIALNRLPHVQTRLHDMRFNRREETMDYFKKKGNKGHSHDSGSARSPRNDTSMTLPLRQVATIFKHN
jgi:hypothetical protein